MNLNVLFRVVSTLSFVIEFSIINVERQDYFIFEGINQLAHLYRENSTLILYLSCDTGYEIFNTSVKNESFQFSWNRYEVNGRMMELQTLKGKMQSLNYENFTILAPIIETFDNEALLDPSLYDNKTINY